MPPICSIGGSLGCKANLISYFLHTGNTCSKKYFKLFHSSFSVYILSCNKSLFNNWFISHARANVLPLTIFSCVFHTPSGSHVKTVLSIPSLWSNSNHIIHFSIQLSLSGLFNIIDVFFANANVEKCQIFNLFDSIFSLILFKYENVHYS